MTKLIEEVLGVGTFAIEIDESGNEISREQVYRVEGDVIRRDGSSVKLKDEGFAVPESLLRPKHEVGNRELRLLLELLYSYAKQYAAFYEKNIKILQ